MDDLLQDMADDDDGDGGEPVRDPKTVDLFESIPNRLDHDNILFGSPRWLENFREKKQVAIDPSIRTVQSTRRRCILTSRC